MLARLEVSYPHEDSFGASIPLVFASAVRLCFRQHSDCEQAGADLRAADIEALDYSVLDLEHVPYHFVH